MLQSTSTILGLAVNLPCRIATDSGTHNKVAFEIRKVAAILMPIRHQFCLLQFAFDDQSLRVPTKFRVEMSTNTQHRQSTPHAALTRD